MYVVMVENIGEILNTSDAMLAVVKYEECVGYSKLDEHLYSGKNVMLLLNGKVISYHQINRICSN
jgi:hypothetical protein